MPARRTERDSLFLRLFDLEADDVSILNLALRKRGLGLHYFDHARFDFLFGPISLPDASQQQRSYLIQPQRGAWRPPHSFVYNGIEVLHLAISRNVHLSDAIQRLL